jgi:hypothetical protein
MKDLKLALSLSRRRGDAECFFELKLSSALVPRGTAVSVWSDAQLYPGSSLRLRERFKPVGMTRQSR